MSEQFELLEGSSVIWPISLESTSRLGAALVLIRTVVDPRKDTSPLQQLSVVFLLQGTPIDSPSGLEQQSRAWKQNTSWTTSYFMRNYTNNNHV
jgi:hypothetical protein